MQKYLIYNTDECLVFDSICYIPENKPWTSCKIYRVEQESKINFEVTKLEDYWFKEQVKESVVGEFSDFMSAVQRAEDVSLSERKINNWPPVYRQYH
jgi:hypothetical protein